MSKKLYVGNLPYSADEETLRAAFSEIGEVLSVKIITDAATGRPRGFGFVEMASDEDAGKAVATLNGSTLMDRTIVVDEARPQPERRRPGGPGGGRGKPRRPSGGRGREPGNWR
jgi:RNA recognition motif-containing protein